MIFFPLFSNLNLKEKSNFLSFKYISHESSISFLFSFPIEYEFD